MPLNKLRKLAPVEVGHWWKARKYVFDKLKEFNVKPGDILCRRGNMFVYGFFPFSDFICWLTGSEYSHAALVLEVTETDILLADLNLGGLRKQFISDWCNDVRGDSILVLRYTGKDIVNKLVVENAKMVLGIDPEENFLDSNDCKSFFCIDLICWCYLRSGVHLCEEIQINKLPKWKKWLNYVAWMHGIDPNDCVNCVGNKEVGLISSPYLETIGEIPFLPQYSKKDKNKFNFRGA